LTDYNTYDKDNLHARLKIYFDEKYDPSYLTEGIPRDVDPYLMDYAMSLYLSPADYALAQREGAYDAVWSKKHQSMIQEWLTSELTGTGVDMAAKTIDPLVDTVLGPIRKIAQEGGTCPGATSTTQCLLDSLSATLVHSKPIVQELIKNHVPLSAWKTNDDFAKLSRRLPAYIEMRNRIWESAIPEKHPWRWGKGNGAKTGKVKPYWVIELQEKNRQKAKTWKWLPDL